MELARLSHDSSCCRSPPSVNACESTFFAAKRGTSIFRSVSLNLLKLMTRLSSSGLSISACKGSLIQGTRCVWPYTQDSCAWTSEQLTMKPLVTAKSPWKSDLCVVDRKLCEACGMYSSSWHTQERAGRRPHPILVYDICDDNELAILGAIRNQGNPSHFHVS